MKSLFRSLSASQSTVFVATICFSATFIGGVLFFKQISPGETLDLPPILMLLAVSIPAAIFGIIFIQVRSADSQRKVAEKVHQRILEIEAETRVVVVPGRRGIRSQALDNSAPEKDPFESL